MNLKTKDAARIDRVRTEKEANGICADCPSPVAIRKDGKPARLCRSCLDADNERYKRRYPTPGIRSRSGGLRS